MSVCVCAHLWIFMSEILCLLAMHLQVQSLHVCLFIHVVSVHYCKCSYCVSVRACMYVSLNFSKGSSHGCHQECKKAAWIDHASTEIIIAQHRNLNHSKHSLGRRHPAQLCLSSIHKAFNSTHCASNLCCNANRIFKKKKKHTSHTHANNRSSHTPLKTMSR